MKFHFNIATFICILFHIIKPMEVSAINTHPRLLVSSHGIKLAKERIKHEQWAKDLYQTLLEQANKLESTQLPVFEKDWWNEASKKPWQEIYHEIGHHTNFAVAEPTLTTRNAALAYLITGDKKYCDAVRKVLLHYTNYDFFAKHPDVGLNWSIWCLRLLQSYDIIYNTLDENDKKVIDDFFFRAMNAIKENDQWWIDNNPGGKFNNHYAWHKIFIGIYGISMTKKNM